MITGRTDPSTSALGLREQLGCILFYRVPWIPLEEGQRSLSGWGGGQQTDGSSQPLETCLNYRETHVQGCAPS